MSNQYGYGHNQNGPYGPYQPAPQQTPPPRRRRTGRLVGIIVGVCLAGIVLVGGCTALMFDGAIDATKADSVPLVKPTQSKPGPSVPTPTTKPTPTPTPAVKRWVTVAKLSGSSTKTGEAFTTTGGRLKLTYAFSGSSYMVGAVYFLPDGQDLAVDGGIPEVMVTEAGRDSTELHKAAGTYYLAIKAANARYTVTVQEYR